jgi:hypothetical protein
VKKGQRKTSNAIRTKSCPGETSRTRDGDPSVFQEIIEARGTEGMETFQHVGKTLSLIRMKR